MGVENSIGRRKLLLSFFFLLFFCGANAYFEVALERNQIDYRINKTEEIINLNLISYCPKIFSDSGLVSPE